MLSVHAVAAFVSNIPHRNFEIIAYTHLFICRFLSMFYWRRLGCVPSFSSLCVIAADILMGSLPSKFASEKEQLDTIRELEKQNKEAGRELADAIREASETFSKKYHFWKCWRVHVHTNTGECQKAVSERIKLVAKEAAVVRNPCWR